MEASTKELKAYKYTQCEAPELWLESCWTAVLSHADIQTKETENDELFSCKWKKKENRLLYFMNEIAIVLCCVPIFWFIL